MKKLLVLGLLSMTLVAIAGQERYQEANYDVETGATLDLSSHKGNIKITTGEAGRISTKVRIYMEDDAYDEAMNQRLIDAVEIKVSEASTKVRIWVDYDLVQDVFNGLVHRTRTMPAVDFEIVVPEDAGLVVESHKSSIDIQAPRGPVELESHKGTGTISGVRNNFKLQTHKGTFTINIEEMADVQVETHKGEVTLNIQDAHDFVLEGETHKGELKFSGYDVEKTDRKHGESVNYKQGSGRYSIDLATHKGMISTNFSN